MRALRITLDNLDGLGAVDYTARVCAEKPLTIKRRLNEPSVCAGAVDCSDGAVKAPVRGARVVVTAENGTPLFTGVVATTPTAVYAGAGAAGPVFVSEFSALSDEWVLDLQVTPLSGAGLAQPGGQLLKTMAAQAGSLTTAGVSAAVPSVGVFVPQAAKTWSENAGLLAGSAYAAYSVLNGALALTPAGTVTHSFALGDGKLNPAALAWSQAKELATDITLTGEDEPAAYVTEYFLGDGTTAEFELLDAPFHLSASKAKLLDDSFDENVVNRQVWTFSDPGSRFALSGGGMQVSGGNGYDGQTTMAAVNEVELGGSLVVELGAVQIGAGSSGVLCGLYQGTMGVMNCWAGFRVRTGTGGTVLVPLLNGAEVGTQFAVQSGHSYALRLRVHSPEMQRVLQTYYTMAGGALTAFGGEYVAAPAAVVMEVQDLGLASSTPSTVLYDGGVASSVAKCVFGAVDSISLTATIGYARVTQSGSAWVVSTPPGGTPGTRLMGTAGDGVDCKLTTTGKLTFFAGRIPVANELIAVSYRRTERSVARLEDAASAAMQAAAGLPATARWLGSVRDPVTRSSADCENAVAAVLTFATDPAAALDGRLEVQNPQLSADVWPGDLVTVPVGAGDATASAVVRAVTIVDGHAQPEVLTYTIAFANDWAEALSMKLSATVPTDVLLPETAATAPGAVAASLQQATLTAYTGTSLTVDAGMVAPVGGGFEVRRRDGGFGVTSSADLVLRTTVRGFTIPRAAQSEEYYVRAYDGSTPPLYSRFSSVIATDLPFE